MAEAIRQAGSTDGPAIQQALENLQRPVEGLLKTYVKPFSRTDHEGLDPADLVWTHWRDAKLEPYGDSVTKSLQSSDFKY
jgi:branched-chain amino acid transport system substrate-binding protein